MEDNLYCRYCGTELEDGIPVCPNCGRDNSVPMLGGRKRSGAAGQAAMSADEYNGPDDGGMGYEPEPEERPLRDPERVSRVRRPVTSAERASQVRRTVEPAERASRVRRPAENAERVGTERPTAPSDQKEEKAERCADLSKKQREVYQLYYVDGFTQAEIAEMLDISQQAVSDRIESIRKKIEEYYAKTL